MPLCGFFFMMLKRNMFVFSNNYMLVQTVWTCPVILFLRQGYVARNKHFSSETCVSAAEQKQKIL